MSSCPQLPCEPMLSNKKPLQKPHHFLSACYRITVPGLALARRLPLLSPSGTYYSSHPTLCHPEGVSPKFPPQLWWVRFFTFTFFVCLFFFGNTHSLSTYCVPGSLPDSQTPIFFPRSVWMGGEVTTVPELKGSSGVLWEWDDWDWLSQ